MAPPQATSHMLDDFEILNAPMHEALANLKANIDKLSKHQANSRRRNKTHVHTRESTNTMAPSTNTHHVVSSSRATTMMAPMASLSYNKDIHTRHASSTSSATTTMAPTWQDEVGGPMYDDDISHRIQDADLLCPICNGQGHLLWDYQIGRASCRERV